jgi:hypothetical protein
MEIPERPSPLLELDNIDPQEKNITYRKQCKNILILKLPTNGICDNFASVWGPFSFLFCQGGKAS